MVKRSRESGRVREPRWRRERRPIDFVEDCSPASSSRFLNTVRARRRRPHVVVVVVVLFRLSLLVVVVVAVVGRRQTQCPRGKKNRDLVERTELTDCRRLRERPRALTVGYTDAEGRSKRRASPIGGPMGGPVAGWR